MFTQQSPPLLPFETTSSLPRYLETDITNDSNNFGIYNRSIGQSGNISYKGDHQILTSTAHLVRLLKFSRHWEEYLNRNLSSERRNNLISSKPNLNSLCSQLVWIVISIIALHSQLGCDIEAISKQLEEIDNIIQVEENSLTSHWITSNDWNLTREWVSRMIGRILGPHRSQNTWSYDYSDIEESFETIYLPSKQKR